MCDNIRTYGTFIEMRVRTDGRETTHGRVGFLMIALHCAATQTKIHIPNGFGTFYSEHSDLFRKGPFVRSQVAFVRALKSPLLGIYCLAVCVCVFLRWPLYCHFLKN